MRYCLNVLQIFGQKKGSGTVEAQSGGHDAAIKATDLSIAGGEFSALAVESRKVCKEDLPLTFTDDVWVVYGETVGEAAGTLQAGNANIPNNSRYLKAAPIELSGAVSGNTAISASFISEGSMRIIIGCAALVIGAALEFMLCKKI